LPDDCCSTTTAEALNAMLVQTYKFDDGIYNLKGKKDLKKRNNRAKTQGKKKAQEIANKPLVVERKKKVIKYGFICFAQ